jgi:hypothetical protein
MRLSAPRSFPQSSSAPQPNGEQKGALEQGASPIRHWVVGPAEFSGSWRSKFKLTTTHPAVT